MNPKGTESNSEHHSRLLVILAADGVGFSRLMALDEHQTLDALDAARAIFRLHITTWRGRVIDTAGDSILATFDTALGAVEAALAIQSDLRTSAPNRASASHLAFRIGIHLGDVIEKDDGSTYGTGVNIASRLQTLSEPGGIVASKAIFELVGNRIDASWRAIGEQRVKNIDRPVAAFQIAPGASDAGSPSDASTHSDPRAISRTWLSPGRLVLGGVALLGAVLGGLVGYWSFHGVTPFGMSAGKANTVEPGVVANPLSIAILPFRNSTGDSSLAYVAEGLTTSVSAGLISDLTSYEDASVIPASITSAYRDRASAAQSLAQDFGVHFVLQGDVQRSRTTIRFTLQLIDAVRNLQVWSGSYDGDEADLLALQEKVLKTNAVFQNMYIAAAHNSLDKKDIPNASDFYVRGLALEFAGESQATKEQEVALFRQMLALEPDSPKAMICLGSALTDLATTYHDAETDHAAIEHAFEEGHRLILAAQARGSKHQWIYESLALYASYHDDYAGALNASKAWLAADPNDPVPRKYVADAYFRGGEPELAIAFAKQALEMDSTPPGWGELPVLGKAYFMLGQNDAAIDTLQKARALSPGIADTSAYLAMASAEAGDLTAAEIVVASLHEQHPEYSWHEFARLSQPGSTTPTAYRTFWETKLIPAWRKAGLPN
ncbi:MAG: adenylate/guanylate cyclase domain-containing protein [Burkholderiaceae bacterium]|jgi:class 3 adenylate cyclase/TolB-like protein